MEITINRKKLVSLLETVAPFVSNKNVFMILRGVHVLVHDGRITLEASDGQNVIRSTTDIVSGDADGSFVISLDTYRFIQKLSDEEVRIVCEDNNTITLSHGKGIMRYQAMPGAEFPLFETDHDGGVEIAIPAVRIREAVEFGSKFTASDPFRSFLRPVYAYVKDGEFGYCATDTHRLINDHTPTDVASDVDVHWFIEPSLFGVLPKLCSAASEVRVAVTPTHATYVIGDTFISTVQTKGRYPDFNRVIPKNHDLESIVDKSELSDSLGRITIMSPNTRLMKCAFTYGNIKLSTEDINSLRYSDEQVPQTGCTKDFTIGLAVDYVQTCLSVISAESVVIRMTDANHPVLFSDVTRPNLTVLQMPMHVS